MNKLFAYTISALCIALLAACSSTSKIPEGEQLFTGLKKIKYVNYTDGDHFDETKKELDAALAAKPNGSLFGSSYYRSPIQFRLWMWNAFSDSESKMGKWLTKNFGKAPILMSQVNPELRTSVAESVLKNKGYFRGKVDYETFTQSNPKKGKIGYTVKMNHLFTLDSIEYENFPPVPDSLIDATLSDAKIHRGDPFDVSTLESERQRIGTLLRNNGYFYYQPNYASYLADTLAVPGKVQLKMELADGVPEQALHQWYIGKIDIDIRKQFMERLNDSITRRSSVIHFNGKRPKLRPRIITRNVKFRKGQQYSYENYLESLNKLTAMGLFNVIDFKFTPRDTLPTCDTLDLRLNCVLDKPYDFYIETNLTGKTTGRLGPGLSLGFTKRNAFRGGEKLNVNLWGSYEWQTGHKYDGSSSKVNSYEYGLEASLEFPRLVLPGFRLRTKFYSQPSTYLKVSFDDLNRAGFFRRRVISSEWTYRFQTSATTIHQFSPLIIEYDYMLSSTEKFDSIRQANPYLDVSMRNQFVPKMRYTYIYMSPSDYRNPIYWETTVSEAGNILSLGYMAAGKKWGTKDKKMFSNEYAQFLKIETDFRKTWSLTEQSQLVGHLNLGFLWAYGNSEIAPYNEQFYVGGANSLRAFTVRTIGPGSYVAPDNQISYMDQTGDLKFVANLEYRFPLFGKLSGATFLDAGNVWTLRDSDTREGGKFEFKNTFDQLALGTGVGLRYDIGYFVIRLDWGIALHFPFDTGKSGYFNTPSFKDGQSIHLAIGYPF